MRPISGAFESDVDTSDDDAVFVLLGVDDESSFVSLLNIRTRSIVIFFTFLFAILLVSIFLHHFFF